MCQLAHSTRVAQSGAAVAAAVAGGDDVTGDSQALAAARLTRRVSAAAALRPGSFSTHIDIWP